MTPAIKRVLVTGSSGTIGTSLCEQLLAQGYQVTGIDWKPNKWNREVNTCTKILDLRDSDVLGQIDGRFDLIIHLAANARVYELVKDPSMARDNFETLFNVIEFARKNQIQRFIFASSREVYGNSDKLIHTEEEAFVKNCESPYTASKIGGEALVRSYQQCYGLNSIILRFSNVYGMYDDTDRLVPLFIRRALAGEPLYVFGKEKLLDFTHLTDAVDGVLRSIEHFEKIKNNTFNLGTGKAATILEVAQLVKRFLDSQSEIVLKESRTGEVVRYIADISKARKMLGYEPKVTIAEGLQRSIEWYKLFAEKNGETKAAK